MEGTVYKHKKGALADATGRPMDLATGKAKEMNTLNVELTFLFPSRGLPGPLSIRTGSAEPTNVGKEAISHLSIIG